MPGKNKRNFVSVSLPLNIIIKIDEAIHNRWPWFDSNRKRAQVISEYVMNGLTKEENENRNHHFTVDNNRNNSNNSEM
jgi:metal-responsive CopG/Arc/MetJ family transcriptional regulator